MIHLRGSSLMLNLSTKCRAHHGNLDKARKAIPERWSDSAQEAWLTASVTRNS